MDIGELAFLRYFYRCALWLREFFFCPRSRDISYRETRPLPINSLVISQFFARYIIALARTPANCNARESRMKSQVDIRYIIRVLRAWSFKTTCKCESYDRSHVLYIINFPRHLHLAYANFALYDSCKAPSGWSYIGVSIISRKCDDLLLLLAVAVYRAPVA